MRPLLLLFAAALLTTSCGDGTTQPPPAAPPSALYALNGLGETLTRIDLDTGQTTPFVLALGSMPNALLFDHDLDRLFAVNSGDNTVWSLDPDSLTRNVTYDLGPNANPYAVAITSGGELAVSAWLSADVAFFDVASGALLRRVPVGRTPEALLALPGKLLVTVVNYDFPSGSFGPGEVVEIAEGAAAAGRRAAVGANPQDLVAGPDGRVHVVCTGNYADEGGRVFFLDAGAMTAVDSLELGGSPAEATVAGDDVYVSGYFGGLLKYDGKSHALLRGTSDPVVNAEGLGGLAFDAARERLYLAVFPDDVVYSVDTAADTLAGAWSVGDGPQDLELVTR